jgi:hypothetical protein
MSECVRFHVSLCRSQVYKLLKLFGFLDDSRCGLISSTERKCSFSEQVPVREGILPDHIACLGTPV